MPGSEVVVGVVAQRESYVVDGQAEDLLGVEDCVQASGDFVGDLIGAAEDVGVVEADLAYPGQSGQNAGSFGSEHGAEFVQSNRQLAVRMLLCGEDHGVVWAVRGTQHEVFAADPHGWEHVVGELFPVPGPLEQRPFPENR